MGATCCKTTETRVDEKNDYILIESVVIESVESEKEVKFIYEKPHIEKEAKV
jgi:hypothetical protein